jgi:hypothetical protein
MALRAGGCAPNITAFVLRESVALVSGQCGVPQWPGTTRLSRGFGGQRGHVSPPVATLGGNGTSPLDPVRCSVISASGQGGVPPCPRSTKLSRGVRGSCGTRPLRQNYITPHCSQCPPVSRKLLLWQPPLRALRVKATGVMQNCLRWSGRTAVGASRSLARPTRHRLRALVVVVAPGHQSGAARCVAGQWPAASHVVCAPAHPCASPLRGSALRAGLPVRPPWGLPQPARLLG